MSTPAYTDVGGVVKMDAHLDTNFGQGGIYQPLTLPPGNYVFDAAVDLTMIDTTGDFLLKIMAEADGSKGAYDAYPLTGPTNHGSGGWSTITRERRQPIAFTVPPGITTPRYVFMHLNLDSPSSGGACYLALHEPFILPVY
ncbi:MAG: hypothetical protein ACYC5F_09825 [Thermoleophilia bacterium]